MLYILRYFRQICRAGRSGGIGAVLSLVLLALLPASAVQASAQTLEVVKSAGKLRVGVQAANMPWGFADESGALVGYDIDVARLLANEIGVDLELVPVTGQSRIAQLVTGKVDILFAVLGMFPDRAEVLQFTKPYAGLSYWVIGPKDREIKDFPDLSGLKISASKASAEEKIITEKAPAEASIVRYDDPQSSILALMSGQADVIVGNSTYIGNFTRRGRTEFENKIKLGSQYQGGGIRKNDKEFLDFVNGFLDKAMANGELEKISQKWLLEPLPEFPESIDGISWKID